MHNKIKSSCNKSCTNIKQSLFLRGLPPDVNLWNLGHKKCTCVQGGREGPNFYGFAYLLTGHLHTIVTGCLKNPAICSMTAWTVMLPILTCKSTQILLLYCPKASLSISINCEIFLFVVVVVSDAGFRLWSKWSAQSVVGVRRWSSAHRQPDELHSRSCSKGPWPCYTPKDSGHISDEKGRVCMAAQCTMVCAF